MPQVHRVWLANMQVYGADKVWLQFNREGVSVARCTVERLMRRQGLQGARRGKAQRTTIPDPKSPCPLDRVNRQFRADRPNQLWVSDFTYVSTWQGWVYVAFVVNVVSQRIVGWRQSSSMQYRRTPRRAKLPAQGLNRLPHLRHHQHLHAGRVARMG